ncbi:hypothetical protein IWQ49_002654 [Labrenzia sp. EL_126]|nr:hypothetical protein [Labrenzia sp. EL_126]
MDTDAEIERERVKSRALVEKKFGRTGLMPCIVVS